MNKMDKPLSDWTLGEVRELCAGRSHCKGCPMAGVMCFIDKTVCPQEWILTDKPRFTEEEVAVLRALQSAGIDTIERGTKLEVLKAKSATIDDGCGSHYEQWFLPQKLLPSLRPGQSVRLEDVLEEV